MLSSLLNTGQQVGGSIGLAILGTVAWSAASNNIRSQAAAAAAAAKHHAAVHLSAARAAALQKAVTDHALSVGFAKGYEVSTAIGLALIITVVAIRVKPSDLAGSTR